MIQGSVTIYKSGTPDCRQIKINGDWYKGSEFFSLKKFDECLVITRHYLDVPDNSLMSKRGYLHCICDAPIGRYKISDESNEDELVVYFDE